MATIPDWRHVAGFPDDAASVSPARAFVTGYLVDHDLRNMVDDPQVVVSELATNALLHCGTGFLVLLFGFKGSVRMEVHDESVEVPVQVDTTELAVGGRGLSIVDTLSRDWGVTTQEAGGKATLLEVVLGEMRVPTRRRAVTRRRDSDAGCLTPCSAFLRAHVLGLLQHGSSASVGRAGWRATPAGYSCIGTSPALQAVMTGSWPRHRG